MPAGQLDAARVLGLSHAGRRSATWSAPQALRVALPPVTNDFIALLKDSSLVSVVTLTELTKTYTNLAASTRDHLGLGAPGGASTCSSACPSRGSARWVERRLGEHLEVTR